MYIVAVQYNQKGGLVERSFYKIWNQGNSDPRVYCPTCGRKITSWNANETFKLKFERVVENVLPTRPSDSSGV